MFNIKELGKQRTSPRRPWRTGLFVIEAMVTGGLVARRKPLTKSTNYPVRPVGWVSKRPTEMKTCFICILCQNACKGLAIHFAFFRGFDRLVIHREHLGTYSLLPERLFAGYVERDVQMCIKVNGTFIVVIDSDRQFYAHLFIAFKGY